MDTVKNKKSWIWRIIKLIVVIIILIILAFCSLVAFLTVTEWKPEDVENAQMHRMTDKAELEKNVKTDKEYSLLTFNIGYCGLGEEADFFMDGGKEVLAKDEATVVKNMKGIDKIIKEQNADFNFLQEIDIKSKRSYYVDEKEFFDKSLGGNTAFAYNYKTLYVPYPVLHHMGRVEAGLYTQSKYDLEQGKRYSLPVPFKWPVRLANLKRCLLVNRIPVEGTDKELVLINLHLEAYDDGEGKKKQTEMLMKFVNDEYAKGNYVIAAGDWNQHFVVHERNNKAPKGKKEALWNPQKVDLGEAGKNWKQVYGTNVDTCRLDNQPYTVKDEHTRTYIIDGAIISPNIKLKQVTNIDEGFKYSDHNPMLMKFELVK